MRTGGAPGHKLTLNSSFRLVKIISLSLPIVTKTPRAAVGSRVRRRGAVGAVTIRLVLTGAKFRRGRAVLGTPVIATYLTKCTAISTVMCIKRTKIDSE